MCAHAGAGAPAGRARRRGAAGECGGCAQSAAPPPPAAAAGAPDEDGRVKASRRLMRKGWRRRRRMQTSRSTRLACSGLLSTSGMRLSATCGRAGRADQARARRASPAAAGRARRAPPARRMLICILRRQLGAASARAARPARLPPPRFSNPQPPGGQPRGHAGERPAQACAQRVRACSPVTASRAEQTLLKDPLPSSLTSWYRSPTCAAAHAQASRDGTVHVQCMPGAAQCPSTQGSRPADMDTSCSVKGARTAHSASFTKYTPGV